jgi:hypothetical protein
MINGAHIIIYSKDAEADKAFIKNVLKFKYVDVQRMADFLTSAIGSRGSSIG